MLIVVRIAGSIDQSFRVGESNKLIDMPIGVVSVDRITGQPDRVLGTQVLFKGGFKTLAEFFGGALVAIGIKSTSCLLYTSPSPRDATLSRMPSSA